jgi:hypothetical protein
VLRKADETHLLGPKWSPYTKSNQVLIQLEGGNMTTIKDDFRKEEMEFFMSNSAILRL